MQFADVCGADLANTTIVKSYSDVAAETSLGTFQGIVLIMPAVILAFVAFCCKFFFFLFFGVVFKVYVD